jgi:hypothetical protein
MSFGQSIVECFRWSETGCLSTERPVGPCFVYATSRGELSRSWRRTGHPCRLQWRLVCHSPTGCFDIAGRDVNVSFCSLESTIGLSNGKIYGSRDCDICWNKQGSSNWDVSPCRDCRRDVGVCAYLRSPNR